MENISGAIPLRSIQEIPDYFRSLFANYPCFNRVQSAVFNDIVYSNSSMVITAPTGSGKTVIFELAILKLMMDASDFKSLKIVYVAPVKALCNERYNDWHPRFKPFGISVIEVTGDSLENCDLQDHQIIITTPEKWDSLTRRWRDNVSLVQMVKLVMIDEVHLLSDNKRGPILETIVCRMKTVMRVLKLQTKLRFIAVSATIFNIEDLGKWLGSNDADYKFHRFGHEVRPVTLNRIVKGYPLNKSAYLFDIQLSYKLKTLLLEYGDRKPTLIFCSTRRGVVQTCKTLMEAISFNFTQEQSLLLEEVSKKIIDVKLKEYVRRGGAYHHAGMVVEDRLMVQDAFADGILPVLVATSTLAMGVNLPAHLVIIKSTHQYIAGRIVEYPESSVLQMVGRAGRPQFDTTATAVIMTKTQMVNKYQNLLDCKEVIESNLHLHLPEQLNAEIVLLTIFDLSVAMQWIQCTFLYIRALKNPQYYGLSGNANKIEKDLELMVLRAINALKRAQLIEMNENGLDITSTTNGRLMSHYYINFNTFQLFFQINEFATIKDIIEILSNANELSEIQLRVNDKRPLNELNVSKNTDTIRFKLSGKIKSRELKINCLVQACLGCLPMDPALQQESIRIINILERIVKCLTEFLTRKNSYSSLLSSVILGKCLHAKLWENSSFVSRQLDRIGATLGATFVSFGKNSFNALLESHPHELERIVNRGPPFGCGIIEQIRHLPMYSLLLQLVRKSILNCTLHIKISIINKELVILHNTAGHNHSIILIIGDTNNRLIMYKRIFDEMILNNFEVALEIKAPMPHKVFVHVISEQWVGIDVIQDVLINPMAAIIVGSGCYLPSIDSNNKKAKIVEDKRNKVTPIVKKAAKPITKKIETPHPTNLDNVDSFCCFDLEPDWINDDSSDVIEVDSIHQKTTDEELTSANNFTKILPDFSVISSPIPPESSINNLVYNQELYSPKSNLYNYENISSKTTYSTNCKNFISDSNCLNYSVSHLTPADINKNDCDFNTDNSKIESTYEPDVNSGFNQDHFVVNKIPNELTLSNNCKNFFGDFAVSANQIRDSSTSTNNYEHNIFKISTSENMEIDKLTNNLSTLNSSTTIVDNSENWQVAEILSPNLNINIADRENRDINSIISQILPNESLFNVQSIDPIETTSNWNEIEHKLLNVSQTKSKLSSFHERFCCKKSLTAANKPFVSLSQQNLKMNNLPKESNFALDKSLSLSKEPNYDFKKINKENIPPKS